MDIRKLQDNKDIFKAKEILESKGYKVRSKESVDYDSPHTMEYKSYTIQVYNDFGATVYKKGKKVAEFPTVEEAREFIDNLLNDRVKLEDSLQKDTERAFTITFVVDYSDGDAETGMTAPETYVIIVFAKNENLAKIEAKKDLGEDSHIIEVHPSTEEELGAWNDYDDDPEFMKESTPIGNSIDLDEAAITKEKAIQSLISSLKSEYIDYDVSWNNYHNCVEVKDTKGNPVLSCYLDREPEDTNRYKYELIEDHSTIRDDEKVYRKVLSGSGRRYNYREEGSIEHHISNVSVR